MERQQVERQMERDFPLDRISRDFFHQSHLGERASETGIPTQTWPLTGALAFTQHVTKSLQRTAIVYLAYLCTTPMPKEACTHL